MKPVVVAIAAIGKNRALGKENKLLWHIPDDLKRFREITTGHPVIMGWRTFQSILGYTGKPFPNRTNIVISIDPTWSYQGVVVASSIEDALERAKALDTEKIFIVGGALTYKDALPYTDLLQLTIIDEEKDADAYFPEYETEFSKKVFEKEHELNGLKYRWIDLER